MYTQTDIQTARGADLYTYLIGSHPSEVKKEGSQYLRLKRDHKIVIRRGPGVYYDNNDGSSGNALDFLVRYLGYSFQSAVDALLGGEAVRVETVPYNPEIALPAHTDTAPPTPIQGRYSRVYAYLVKTRGLDPELVTQLIHRRLLYEDTHHNAVFMNAGRTMAEIRGTNTVAQEPFRSRWGFKGDGYWYYAPQPDRRSERVYICEAAIDTLSLYQLLQDNNAVYVSMTGVHNQWIIDKIKRYRQVVLCVDNDKWGQKRRDQNPDLQYLIPTGKDWNEDLLRRIRPKRETILWGCERQSSI